MSRLALAAFLLTSVAAIDAAAQAPLVIGGSGRSSVDVNLGAIDALGTDPGVMIGQPYGSRYGRPQLPGETGPGQRPIVLKPPRLDGTSGPALVSDEPAERRVVRSPPPPPEPKPAPETASPTPAEASPPVLAGPAVTLPPATSPATPPAPAPAPAVSAAPPPPAPPPPAPPAPAPAPPPVRAAAPPPSPPPAAPAPAPPPAAAAPPPAAPPPVAAAPPAPAPAAADPAPAMNSAVTAGLPAIAGAPVPADAAPPPPAPSRLMAGGAFGGGDAPPRAAAPPPPPEPVRPAAPPPPPPAASSGEGRLMAGGAFGGGPRPAIPPGQAPITSPAPPRSAVAVAPADSREIPPPVAPRAAAPPQTAMAPPTAAIGPILSRIDFGSGAETLSPDAQAKLTELARRLARSEERINLRSFASGADEGTARRLALTRAIAVRRFLGDKEVAVARINFAFLGQASDGGPADRVDIQSIGR